MAIKPVVALDIDGTLGDYHGHFTKFAAQWIGREMPDHNYMLPDEPFFKFLGMSKQTYRQCKLAFRMGGMHRSMPMYPGADEMVKSFRSAGAEVWLCTTRPYLQMDTTDRDTRHWLRRNGIQYDAIIYGPHKYRELVKQVSADRVVIVLDDLAEQCNEAESLGLPVTMKAQPYNEHEDFIRLVGGYPVFTEMVVEEIRRRKQRG